MSAPTTCERCGTRYDSGRSPAGLCPGCLARSARSEARGAAESSSPGSRVGSRRVPTAEELAPHFPQLDIGAELGRGGMGVVYRARQVELGRDVALKVLTVDAAADASFAERFRREARALASLSHPGVVHVHDFGRTGGWCWLLMELVEGASLRQILAAGPVEPARTLAIVRQTCVALEYAHEQGVVHRDVKPENVLVDREGTVKLVDFGLARLVGEGDGGVTLTRTGQAMGTPHYMAPEQWRDPQSVDHRADIYALGVVLYELLTRELPMGRFEPPSRRVVVDVRLDEIVLKAMEVEPGRRYQRTREVRTDLDALRSAPLAAVRSTGPGERAGPEGEGAGEAPLEAGGPAALALRACLVAGVSLAFLAAAMGLRAIRLAGVVDTVAEREPLVDSAATSTALVGFALGLVALSRAALRARDRSSGISPPLPLHLRPWLLPSLALAACLQLAYAANATPDRPLTESAWMAAAWQGLSCGLGWLALRLGRDRSATAASVTDERTAPHRR